MSKAIRVYFVESVQTGDVLFIRADSAGMFATRKAKQGESFNGLAMNNFQVGDFALWNQETGNVYRYAK